MAQQDPTQTQIRVQARLTRNALNPDRFWFKITMIGWKNAKQEKSDNSGDETSDSGVQTPPPELHSDQDDKPEKVKSFSNEKSELLSSLDKLRQASSTNRVRTRSE